MGDACFGCRFLTGWCGMGGWYGWYGCVVPCDGMGMVMGVGVVCRVHGYVDGVSVWH